MGVCETRNEKPIYKENTTCDPRNCQAKQTGHNHQNQGIVYNPPISTQQAYANHNQNLNYPSGTQNQNYPNPPEPQNQAYPQPPPLGVPHDDYPPIEEINVNQQPTQENYYPQPQANINQSMPQPPQNAYPNVPPQTKTYANTSNPPIIYQNVQPAPVVYNQPAPIIINTQTGYAPRQQPIIIENERCGRGAFGLVRGLNKAINREIRQENRELRREIRDERRHHHHHNRRWGNDVRIGFNL